MFSPFLVTRVVCWSVLSSQRIILFYITKNTRISSFWSVEATSVSSDSFTMLLLQVGHFFVMATHCSMHGLQNKCAQGVMVSWSISERHILVISNFKWYEKGVNAEERIKKIQHKDHLLIVKWEGELTRNNSNSRVRMPTASYKNLLVNLIQSHSYINFLLLLSLHILLDSIQLDSLLSLFICANCCS